MLFNTDKQTLDDLNIFGKRGDNSIFFLYNHTRTQGGSIILTDMFQHPLSDADKINSRCDLFKYFTALTTIFPVKAELCNVAALYLSNIDNRTKLSVEKITVAERLTNLIAEDNDYKNIYKGVAALISILQDLYQFTISFGIDLKSPYQQRIADIKEILIDPVFNSLLADDTKGKIPFTKVAAYDAILRFQHRESIQKLLQFIYELDVYISIAQIANERQFVYPKALKKENRTANFKGLYHPQLQNAVPNDLILNASGNVVFLTGANMAGKSTFMKSLGIAMYLAHMGLPVAAKAMEFSVLNGIYTTINLPDNLGMGVSHFYAEVLRLKKVANEVSREKHLLVIFDELFRGTNVKDAYEATIAVTEAFAKKRNAMFIISTHIMEAGEVLKERCENISLQYLPTHMSDNKPVYTYTLETGITADRHGMIIINNEGILDILKKGKESLI